MPSQVDGVRYSADGESVLCEHCDIQIRRGTDYAVRLYFEEDTGRENPIGPYCSNCIEQLKVCCGCNKAFFGDDIKYFERGIYYCTECVATKEMCSHCGTLGELMVHNGKKMCTRCFKKNYSKCGVCGETHAKTKFSKSTNLNMASYKSMYKKYGEICDACTTTTQKRFKKNQVYECNYCHEVHAKNKPYCSKCMKNLNKCTFCKKPHHQLRDMHDKVLDKYLQVCPECKPSTCSSCGAIGTDKLQKRRGLFNEIEICPNCFSANKGECASCLSFKELGTDGNCSSCHNIFEAKCTKCDSPSLNGSSSSCRHCSPGACNIQSYGYKPDPLFHYTPQDVLEKDNCFLGFENEIIVDTSASTALYKMYKHGFDHTIMNAKSDSSICGEGYELVSHPHTLRAFQELDMSPLLAHAKIDDSCGMHVHFDRKCLTSEVHLYKFIQFIHENEKFSDVIAGRKYTGYAKKMDKKASKAVKDNRTSRYQRVNLLNRATVEVRMFQNANRTYKLMMRLEFVHALVYYTKDASIKACKGYGGFLRFIALNKKRYPNLSKFTGSPIRFWSK